MNALLGLFLLFLIPLGFAEQDYLEPHAPVQISEIYTSGEYLIFDCKKRFYVCVDALNFEQCGEDRQFAIKQGYLNLPCAPLKKFDHHQYCVHAQYEKIYGAFNKEFCFAPDSVLRD